MREFSDDDLVEVTLPKDIPANALISVKWSDEVYLKLPFPDPIIPNPQTRVVSTEPAIAVKALPGEEIHARWADKDGGANEIPPDPSDKNYYIRLKAFSATVNSRWRTFLVVGENQTQEVVQTIPPPKRWWEYYGFDTSRPIRFALDLAIGIPSLIILLTALLFEDSWADVPAMIIVLVAAVVGGANLIREWLAGRRPRRSK